MRTDLSTASLDNQPNVCTRNKIRIVILEQFLVSHKVCIVGLERTERTLEM